jgi:hypothetical protein
VAKASTTSARISRTSPSSSSLLPLSDSTPAG